MFPSPEGDPTTPRFTLRAFHLLHDAGAFPPDLKVELVNGQIIMSARPASVAVIAAHLARAELQRIFGDGHTVYIEGGFTQADNTESGPDLLVRPGGIREAYGDQTPRSAVMIVEVANTSQAVDHGLKRLAYAEARVPEYWVLDVRARTLTVYRRPTEPRRGGSWDYAERVVHDEAAEVVPLAAPEVTPPVRVAELLP